MEPRSPQMRVWTSLASSCYLLSEVQTRILGEGGVWEEGVDRGLRAQPQVNENIAGKRPKTGGAAHWPPTGGPLKESVQLATGAGELTCMTHKSSSLTKVLPPWLKRPRSRPSLGAPITPSQLFATSKVPSLPAFPCEPAAKSSSIFEPQDSPLFWVRRRGGQTQKKTNQ